MERQPHSPERHSLKAENLEQLIHLRRHEREQQHSPEQSKERIEQARQQIEHHGERTPHEQVSQPAGLTGYERLRAYRHTLASLQHRLRPRQRSFSRFIHRPIIERASEVMASTIARPSVALGATVTAALVGGFFYISARRYGFQLSGSEFIVSLLAGGLLGFALEQIGRWLRTRRQA